MDLTIERPVALKTLNQDLPEEILDEVKQRFLREAKSAGKLNHPNIVTIYEFGEADGIAFIAMEYLEGKSLHEVMRGDRLPFATVAEVIAQIADGLDYAHRFGVVHRDIKPANIMVSPHGLAKLTDFGIARIQSSTMTQAGTMMGSPKYMAPEQVLGQQIDGRADIFALGVVFYELVARRTPFEHDAENTMFSLMQRIVTAPQPRLAELLPGVPPAFDLILSRALAKKPDERYQRASQFANDLRNYKSLLGDDAIDPAEKTTITRRGPVIDAAGNALAANAPAAASTGQQYPQPTAPAGWQSAPAGPTTVPPAPPPPATPSRFAAATAGPDPAFADKTLIGDLSALASGIDEAQRKFLQEEAEAMATLRRAAPRAKDWDALGAGIEQAPAEKPAPHFGGESAGGKDAAANNARKSGVFGLLRQQASQNLKGQAEAQRDAQARAMLELDTRVRAGYDFLLEFCKELNAANPVFAGNHNLLYYGPCPALYISDALVNARLSRIDDRGKIRDVLDHLLVSYYMLSPEKGRVSVNAAELPKFKAILDLHEMAYEHRETKNDFHQVIRAGFKFEFKFICSFTLKVDYTENNIDITCRNVGPLGRTRYVVPADKLDVDFFEELTKVILGFPSEAAAAFLVPSTPAAAPAD
jgi:hypothetical protein